MITRLMILSVAAILCFAVYASADIGDGYSTIDNINMIMVDNPRKDRRDDRKDDRDDKQDCRQEEGLVGDDKRECKQEDRGDGDGDDEAEPEVEAEPEALV